VSLDYQVVVDEMGRILIGDMDALDAIEMKLKRGMHRAMLKF
jgi:hypothetical protein